MSQGMNSFFPIRVPVITAIVRSKAIERIRSEIPRLPAFIGKAYKLSFHPALEHSGATFGRDEAQDGEEQRAAVVRAAVAATIQHVVGVKQFGSDLFLASRPGNRPAPLRATATEAQ